MRSGTLYHAGAWFMAILGSAAWTSLSMAQPTGPATTKPAAPAAPQPASEADWVASLVGNLGNRSKSREFFGAYSTLMAKLDSVDDSNLGETAQLVLARTRELAGGPQAQAAIAGLAKEKNMVLAARLLLQLARANSTVQGFGKGRVVFGKLKVADKRMEPEMVLAQMVILPEGWFATEIGDTTRPLGFRAAGYVPLDVKIPEKKGEMDLGTVVLQPLGKGQAATLRGKVVFEGPSGLEVLKATISVQVPPANSLSGGYSPRKMWPAPVNLEVGKDGAFVVKNTTPGEHFLSLQTGKHEDLSQIVSVKAGATEDLGTLTLRTTDLGYHLKKETPKAGKIPWEKDIATARKRALAEGKPMMIMMTATWCGPCKMLEAKTLSDPWVQQFLLGFVLVKAYEDKEVEKEYGLTGYPTLVFVDKKGQAAHKSVGYQPIGTFSGQVLQACLKAGVTVDADLKSLADKKVVKVPSEPKKSPVKLN